MDKHVRYEAPTVTVVGSIADLTQGAIPGNTGDGRSGRGPAYELPSS